MQQATREAMLISFRRRSGAIVATSATTAMPITKIVIAKVT
jgi:hypothetical protein